MQAGKGKTIIITGCNKGIGFGVVQKILKNHPEDKIIMAIRTLDNGKKALEELKKTFPDVEKKITLAELDVQNTKSIDKFIDWVKKNNIQADCLLNNAGTAVQKAELTPEIVKATFPTNFYGTIELSEKMVPLLNKNGKIIFITSIMGTHAMTPGFIYKDKLEDPKLTKEGLYKIVDQFKADVAAKKPDIVKGGWFPIYALSKMLLNYYVKVWAQDKAIKEKGIQVYGCHPGWVKTDLGGPMAPMSVEEGTVCPCYLLDLPYVVDEKLQGKFFNECKVAQI